MTATVDIRRAVSDIHNRGASGPIGRSSAEPVYRYPSAIWLKPKDHALAVNKAGIVKTAPRAFSMIGKVHSIVVRHIDFPPIWFAILILRANLAKRKSAQVI